MTTKARAFADYYARMPDEDLQRLALDVQSLVPDARDALRSEMERRQIADASIDWQPQPVLEEIPDPHARSRALEEIPDPVAQSRALTRNLTIFFIVECAVFAGLVFLLPTRDTYGAGSLAYFIFKVGLFLTIVLGDLVSRPSVPRQTKIISVLGVWVPLGLLMLIAAVD